MNYIKDIRRPEIHNYAIHGYILKTSDELILIAREDEFLIDGYLVLHNDDIKICKTNHTTRYISRVMKKEGFDFNVHMEAVRDVDITGWKTLLTSLKKMDEYVIVENEAEENEEDNDFLIGPIRRVNKLSVTIDFFDSAGDWEEPRNIPYEYITCVSFGARYINIHRKYLKKK